MAFDAVAKEGMKEMSGTNYGTKVNRWILSPCYECNDMGASLSPGLLNEDETIEYRKCEEGHTVESEPLFWAPLGEATETGIV